MLVEYGGSRLAYFLYSIVLANPTDLVVLAIVSEKLKY
jgi:hypothetical protein